MSKTYPYEPPSSASPFCLYLTSLSCSSITHLCLSSLSLGVFLYVLLLTAAPRPSWAQESVLDEGPMPDTVQQLMDPLRESFKKPLPLPWLLLRLRRTLRDALQWEARTEQPFFRDTALTLKLRTFY